MFEQDPPLSREEAKRSLRSFINEAILSTQYAVYVEPMVIPAQPLNSPNLLLSLATHGHGSVHDVLQGP